MALLDIEKAFDTIWHDGLIYKLNRSNPPTYLIKIIKSFISDRRFMVEINGEYSDTKYIVAGVPQGSVLSPTLYSIYIADFKCPACCQSAYYADDTALLSATKTTNKSIKNVQKAMEAIEIFSTRWKIKINATKTNFIIFPFNRARRRTPTINLRFQNNTIVPETTVKYLGVTIDQKLNFDKHIESTRNKATRAMCALYPMLARTSGLSLGNKNIIYKTMIRPIIIYAAPIWGHATRARIKRLQIIQNKCLKLIHNLPFHFGTDELHILTKYPKVIELIETHENAFIEKCDASTFEMIRSLFER